MDHTRDHAHHQLLDRFFFGGVKSPRAKGDQIISDDANPDVLYYLASGYVKIYSLKERGEQYIHIIYGAGEIFPLVWLTQKGRHNVFFEALTACEVYCRSVDETQTALKKDSRLAYEMMQQSIEQHRIYSMRVDNLEYKYASERLAYRLLLLGYRFGDYQEDGSVTIDPPLTHQLIGSSINLSRESVSREMEKLLRKGLVRYNDQRQIVIPDRVRLAASFKLTVPGDDIAKAAE